MRQRPLKRWAWVDKELSGPDLPYSCVSELRGAAVHLDCKDLPEDTLITVAGKEQRAAGTFHVEIDVGEALGSVPVKDLVGPSFELDPQTPLVIATPRGTVTTELPKVKYPVLGLAHGAGQPMKLGNEPPPAPNPAGPTVLWLGMEDEAFGPARTLREVDWLAVEGERKIAEGPTCKYQDRQTGAISSAPLSVHAVEVVIYERRTGRVVDRSEFKPLVSCPHEKASDAESVHASVSEDTMKRWLSTRRARP